MKKLLLSTALAVLALGVVFVFLPDRKSEITVQETQRELPESRVANKAPLQQSPPIQAAPHESEVAPAPSSADDESEDPRRMFGADAVGNLLLREQTRLNIEKLLALYTPQELDERLAAIESMLPATAFHQLADLMERYRNYTLASKQAYPPDAAPETVEAALAQYEGLHALRTAHFGAKAADAMYGREERIGRQLLEFMSLERHEGLTMEEKAERAQILLLSSPDLLAAYESDAVSQP